MQLNHRQRHNKIPNPKKPTSPTLKAQLILHKPNIPIRTVIKNMNAPTYKLAKHLIRMLIEHITLNNSFIVTNSTNFVTDLKRLKINVNHKLITYDIKDLFINIPIEDTLTITKALSLKNNNTQITQQIITLLRLVVSQTYFIFQNQTFQPEKWVAMGSPVSNTISEIFLRLETSHWLKKHHFLHTLRRRRTDYIWNHKNNPRPY